MASAGASGSAADGQLEERLDLSSECSEKIGQASDLVSSGQLKEALALLMALEKRCRVGNDNPSLVKTCEACIQFCKDANDHEAMVTTLETLSTRRSQKTQAVRALVHLALPWCTDGIQPIPVANDQEKQARDKLVQTLRDITDGKIFLEAERARLTRAFASIKEQDGDIAQAANVLQDVHVETYGSLSKREKIEFILEQMRLTLAKQDYIRAHIVAGKVNKKFLAEENMQDYKVLYYTLLTQYHRHDKNALELAKDYHAIYSTPDVLAKPEQWKEALQSTVLFLTLAQYSMEQQDMLHRIQKDANLEQLTVSHDIISQLLTHEIINYPLPNQAQMEAFPAFSIDNLNQHWKDVFHTRIIQHNIRVASKYYTRITGSRLSVLLKLEPDRLEQEISSMVSSGSIKAKIDRPKDIVRFDQKKTPEAVLTHWAGDIDKLLDLVESTTHLIHKENMTQ